ncbi:MAG: ABC-2 family transporter protein [Sandaracinaceae bacterium]|nr:ABC-2 family transporter protein [Sandaracinaceae bacterium]
MRTLRTLPALFKVGFVSALAYRAEFLVWMLTSTLPLIMLPLWHAVAEQAPLAGFSQGRFTAYFFTGFIVRQLVGNWASWTINYEVRSGALSQRLLRPIHPIWFYATESLASIPLRSAFAFPAAVIALLVTDTSNLAHDARLWAMVPVAIFGAWAIGFFAHVAIGALSLWMHQSIKVVEIWSAGFFVFSGYLVPIAVFPRWLQSSPHWMPFEYMHGFPIDLITGALSVEQATRSLGAQWCWVGILGLVTVALWDRGLRRYGAFGG